MLKWRAEKKYFIYADSDDKKEMILDNMCDEIKSIFKLAVELGMYSEAGVFLYTVEGLIDADLKFTLLTKEHL